MTWANLSRDVHNKSKPLMDVKYSKPPMHMNEIPQRKNTTTKSKEIDRNSQQFQRTQYSQEPLLDDNAFNLNLPKLSIDDDYGKKSDEMFANIHPSLRPQRSNDDFDEDLITPSSLLMANPKLNNESYDLPTQKTQDMSSKGPPPGIEKIGKPVHETFLESSSLFASSSLEHLLLDTNTLTPSMYKEENQKRKASSQNSDQSSVLSDLEKF